MAAACEGNKGSPFRSTARSASIARASSTIVWSSACGPRGQPTRKRDLRLGSREDVPSRRRSASPTSQKRSRNASEAVAWITLCSRARGHHVHWSATPIATTSRLTDGCVPGCRAGRGRREAYSDTSSRAASQRFHRDGEIVTSPRRAERGCGHWHSIAVIRGQSNRGKDRLRQVGPGLERARARRAATGRVEVLVRGRAPPGSRCAARLHRRGSWPARPGAARRGDVVMLGLAGAVKSRCGLGSGTLLGRGM